PLDGRESASGVSNQSCLGILDWSDDKSRKKLPRGLPLRRLELSGRRDNTTDCSVSQLCGSDLNCEPVRITLSPKITRGWEGRLAPLSLHATPSRRGQ